MVFTVLASVAVAVVMAKRSAMELFEQNYTALVFSLPMKDTDFIDDLLKHDLLPGDLKIRLESLSVLNERSSYFLDNVIKPRLAVDNRRCFVSLLTVMKCNKHGNVQDLAKKIEKELVIDIKCKNVCFNLDACPPLNAWFHKIIFSK